MGEIVAYSLEDGVAVVRIDNPPVNAMDRGVRAGLDKAFSELKGRPDVRAIVIGCAGRTFVAGADIKEFDTGIAEPGFHKVLRLIEDSACPVIAAVHGAALGAGTELALPAIIASRTRTPGSVCRNCRSASFRARGARSACRASSRSSARST